MGKRRSKKSLKKWECSEGCDISKNICPHIEKKLPQIVNTLSRARLTDYYVSVEDTDSHESDWLRLRSDLRTMGLRGEDCELVLDRYVSGLSLEELAKKYHFVSVSRLRYYLDNLKPKVERILRMLYPEGDI